MHEERPGKVKNKRNDGIMKNNEK